MDQQRLLDQISSLDGELRRVGEELDRAWRLATLGTLTGSIVHEFNNILTPIACYSQLALANPGDSALADKALRKAMEGADRASKIASALLGFACDSGEELGAEVESSARAAIACMARDPERDGVRVEIEAAAGLRVALRPVALQHVLLNLALNAVEAMKPGGGRLTIRAHSPRGGAPGNCSTRNNCREGEGHRCRGAGGGGGGGGGGGAVVIEVVDTGRGIPSGVMAQVMTPFVTARVGPEGRRGFGLGLSICRRLVEEGGGSVTIESAAGTGTIVRLTLPAPLNE